MTKAPSVTAIKPQPVEIKNGDSSGALPLATFVIASIFTVGAIVNTSGPHSGETSEEFQRRVFIVQGFGKLCAVVALSALGKMVWQPCSSILSKVTRRL